VERFHWKSRAQECTCNGYNTLAAMRDQFIAGLGCMLLEVVMPTESLTNREWLPGELLSGPERRRPGWFLEMKYQICAIKNAQICLDPWHSTAER